MAVTYPVVFKQKQLKGQYCLSPFIVIEIDLNGNVRMCSCSSWMPIAVGNIFTTPLDQILSSPLAVKIRQSIIDGTYQYCNEKICGVLINNSLNTRDTLPDSVASIIHDASQFIAPYEISLSGDMTCNLSCPSCRHHVVRVPEDQQAKQEELGRILASNIFARSTNQPINILLSTSGELFASSMLLNFVNNIDLEQFPNVTLTVQTNGLLCKSKWHRLGHMQSAVAKTTMTVDAARAETYEILRRGGKWSDALEALEFLGTKKQETGMKFHTRMVVQQLNYQEVHEFYDLSMKYGADLVEYVGLLNWNTYSDSEYQQHNVLDPKHPQQQSAREKLLELKKLPNTWFALDF